MQNIIILSLIKLIKISRISKQASKSLSLWLYCDVLWCIVFNLLFISLIFFSFFSTIFSFSSTQIALWSLSLSLLLIFLSLCYVLSTILWFNAMVQASLLHPLPIENMVIIHCTGMQTLKKINIARKNKKLN